MLRRKEENQDQSHIEKKLKIKRKEVNNLNKKSKSSLQGIPSNFDGTCSLMVTPYPSLLILY